MKDLFDDVEFLDDESAKVNAGYRHIHSRRKKQQDKPPSVARELLGWLLYIAVVVCITYLVITYVGQRTEVSGESMAPTLHSGDNLIVEKLSYRFTDPERYDIIVFPYEYEEGIFYIKRIIGLPGETVLIKDGEVYINGELLGETYGAEVMDSAGIAEEEILLGDNEYFVLGDNRNNSSDSRDPSVGIINGDDIVGKAILRIWPFTEIGVIQHG